MWLAVDPEEHITVLFREIPSGKLKVMRFDAVTSQMQSSLALPKISEAGLIFRAARWHQNNLYVVVYDNVRLKNYLLTFTVSGDGYSLARAPMQLPRLEDPAGGTYEMIPSVYFAAQGSELWLLGGALKSLVSDGEPTEEKIPDLLS